MHSIRCDSRSRITGQENNTYTNVFIYFNSNMQQTKHISQINSRTQNANKEVFIILNLLMYFLFINSYYVYVVCITHLLVLPIFNYNIINVCFVALAKEASKEYCKLKAPADDIYSEAVFPSPTLPEGTRAVLSYV